MRIIAYILFLFVSFVPMIEIVSTGQSVDNKGTSASKYPFSDVEVHKIAGYDIDKLTGKSWDKQPWLYVVPDKKPLPIKDLFVKIKLNPSRLCSPEIYEFNFTTFHVWKLSPSYELWVISAWNEAGNQGLKSSDADWKVAGAKILKREVGDLLP